jgi:hypothetical protein
MEYPLFAFCDGDLSLFWDLDEAEAAIEPPDAKGGAWRVFDRAGYRLSVNIKRRPLRAWWPVSFLSIEGVELSRTSEQARDLMTHDLRQFLHALARKDPSIRTDWVSAAPLDDLIQHAIRTLK